MLALTPDKYQRNEDWAFDECHNAYVKPKRPFYLGLIDNLHKKSDYDRSNSNGESGDNSSGDNSSGDNTNDNSDEWIWWWFYHWDRVLLFKHNILTMHAHFLLESLSLNSLLQVSIESLLFPFLHQKVKEVKLKN